MSMDSRDIEIATALGRIEEHLGHIDRKLETICLSLEKQNGRVRSLEGAYQRARGVLAVLAVMGVAGILAFLERAAKLFGALR